MPVHLPAELLLMIFSCLCDELLELSLACYLCDAGAEAKAKATAKAALDFHVETIRSFIPLVGMRALPIYVQVGRTIENDITAHHRRKEDVMLAQKRARLAANWARLVQFTHGSHPSGPATAAAIIGVLRIEHERHVAEDKAELERVLAERVEQDEERRARWEEWDKICALE
ncbi:hypothetical protein JCM10207_006414 [Rhodosporidiobolus poonsookiae]